MKEEADYEAVKMDESSQPLDLSGRPLNNQGHENSVHSLSRLGTPRASKVRSSAHCDAKRSVVTSCFSKETFHEKVGHENVFLCEKVPVNSCNVPTLGGKKFAPPMIEKTPLVCALKHQTITFNQSVVEHEITPYAEIYGKHPSELVSTAAGLIDAEPRCDPFTSRSGEVMKARAVKRHDQLAPSLHEAHIRRMNILESLRHTGFQDQSQGC